MVPILICIIIGAASRDELVPKPVRPKQTLRAREEKNFLARCVCVRNRQVTPNPSVPHWQPGVRLSNHLCQLSSLWKMVWLLVVLS